MAHLTYTQRRGAVVFLMRYEVFNEIADDFSKGQKLKVVLLQYKGGRQTMEWDLSGFKGAWENFQRKINLQ